MQDEIVKKLGLSPVNEEVVVLYDGEKGNDVNIFCVFFHKRTTTNFFLNDLFPQPPEFWNGKRIVEMNKPRPAWFSKNLLQKTTQKPATTKNVKPTDLA